MNLSLDLDVMSIVIQLVSTLILFGAAKIFLTKPMKKFLQERREFLDAEFEKAEQLNNEVTVTKEQTDLELKKIQAESSQMLQDASARAQVKYDNILATAKSDADKELEKARLRIEKERASMLYDAKKEIEKTATTVASKLVKKEIDVNKHEDLFDDFVALIGGGASE